MTQTLEIYQSLWAMEQRKPGAVEPPIAEHFERIKAAGYHGVCIDPNVDEISDSLALAPLFKDHQLRCMVNAFPNAVDELTPLLDMAAELQAEQVNIIGGVMPLTVSETIPVIEHWISVASAYDFQVLFETHRNATLNDFFATLEILQAVPELRLCADLSHFVVDREFSLPLAPIQETYFERVLQRSDSFQGRISNNEQIQISVQFPQHQAWVTQFKAWWRAGIHAWKDRQTEDATLRFLVELGPPPYAITDKHQKELSDRWEEALIIRAWVEEIWADLTPGTE
ncbi:MAG: sugar phosphate isomerase/epimerase [Gammaproteobacteria bacterium]|jgi:hypothetical protein|nr:sugar phosphate isomerase/epimerase [Gammaproteobacteria bacterium]MBT5053500.1 sugar phosphate isomerase/epimerase [Gammaproteobacteria bacterium]